MSDDCQRIRALVRSQKLVPGSPQQRVVDEHIAGCPACARAIHGTHQTLLGNLLHRAEQTNTRDMLLGLLQRAERPAPAEAPPKPASPAPARPVDSPQRTPARSQSFGALTWSMIVIAGVVGALLAIYGGDLNALAQNSARIYANLGSISTTPTDPVQQPTAAAVDVTTAPTAAAPANVRSFDTPMTVLLLGSDRRPSESTPSRTDAIILLRIDPQAQRIAMLSLPRDLLVTIPGYGMARINAAHVYGDVYPKLGGGFALAKQTISQVVNVPIDYAILVDFQGFINVIDTLGGVPVQVTKSLYDPRFPTMDYKFREVSFEPGTYTMDGLTTLTYSRIRHPDNDFERMRRQQGVLAAIANRLRGGGFLQTVETTAQITDALVGHATTDMPRDEIIALAWQMRATPAANVSFHVFTDIVFGTGENRYAMYPVDGAIPRIVNAWMGKP